MLLGLENLALMVGALALFVAVSIIMLVTQRLQNRDAGPPTSDTPAPDTRELWSRTADGTDAAAIET